MKKLASLILLMYSCYPLLLSAQPTGTATLKKRLERLNAVRKFPMDSTGISRLPKLNYYCDEESAGLGKYYHVLDVNNDGLDDVIYSGPCEGYDHTGIFANTGNSLVCIFSYPGRVISVDHNEFETTINLVKEPCCCDLYYDYTEVVIHSNSEVVRNRITFESGTVVKVNDLKPIKIKGVLRTTPKLLDEEIEDECIEATVMGNHLMVLRELTEVIQLYQEKHWRLVLYQESDEQSWIGWIKWKKN